MMMPDESSIIIARAVAGGPEIGMDRDDPRIPERARLGVPTGVKRRIETQPTAGDLDAGNNRLRGAGGRNEGIGQGGIPNSQERQRSNSAANSSSSGLAAAVLRRAAR